LKHLSGAPIYGRQTRLERLVRDKHSSLLQIFVNYNCKMFYNIRPCFLESFFLFRESCFAKQYKTFSFSSVIFKTNKLGCFSVASIFSILGGEVEAYTSVALLLMLQSMSKVMDKRLVSSWSKHSRLFVESLLEWRPFGYGSNKGRLRLAYISLALCCRL
jgi:hypothetical protein